MALSVEFKGIEYVVDVQNRRFGQLPNPEEVVAFRSDEGREMVRAMRGTGRCEKPRPEGLGGLRRERWAGLALPSHDNQETPKSNDGRTMRSQEAQAGTWKRDI